MSEKEKKEKIKNEIKREKKKIKNIVSVGIDEANKYAPTVLDGKNKHKHEYKHTNMNVRKRKEKKEKIKNEIKIENKEREKKNKFPKKRTKTHFIIFNNNLFLALLSSIDDPNETIAMEAMNGLAKVNLFSFSFFFFFSFLKT